MASGVQSLAQGISDGLGVPAVAKIGPNLRALTATAPVGVVGDIVAFPGPPATPTLLGTWTFGSTRVTATGAPVVTQTAQSTTVTIGGAGGPMVVLMPDVRVLAL
ncbi:MAG: hypothetical protein AAGB15_11845 [Pseudomonadota bacterium]